MRKCYAATLMCFALLLVLSAPLRAQADEDNYDKMRLGVGLGLFLNQATGLYPMPRLYLGYQYAFSSFYRMGIEGRLGYLPMVHLPFTTTWTHEFVLGRSEGFEVTSRVGIGYLLIIAAVPSDRHHTGPGGVEAHGLAFDLGMGFGWIITDLLLLRLGIDYTLAPMLSSGERGALLHELNVAFSVVFRL